MIETAAATPKVSHNEQIKAANPTLAGTIGATLADPAVVEKLKGQYQDEH